MILTDGSGSEYVIHGLQCSHSSVVNATFLMAIMQAQALHYTPFLEQHLVDGLVYIQIRIEVI